MHNYEKIICNVIPELMKEISNKLGKQVPTVNDRYHMYKVFFKIMKDKQMFDMFYRDIQGRLSVLPLPKDLYNIFMKIDNLIEPNNITVRFEELVITEIKYNSHQYMKYILSFIHENDFSYNMINNHEYAMDFDTLSDKSKALTRVSKLLEMMKR